MPHSHPHLYHNHNFIHPNLPQQSLFTECFFPLQDFFLSICIFFLTKGVLFQPLWGAGNLPRFNRKGCLFLIFCLNSDLFTPFLVHQWHICLTKLPVQGKALPELACMGADMPRPTHLPQPHALPPEMWPRTHSSVDVAAFPFGSQTTDSLVNSPRW